MKIYRHPQTDASQCVKTDEIHFDKLEDLVGFQNAKSVDITIDKDGNRGSMAILQFEECDLENLHQRYIDHLRAKITTLEEVLEKTSELALLHKRQNLKHKANWEFITEVIANKSKWLGYINQGDSDDYTTIEELIETMGEDMYNEGVFDSSFYDSNFEQKYKDHVDFNIDPEEWKEL